MSFPRNLLFIAGIAVAFPCVLAGIGVAQCYASGDSLSVTVLLECLYFLAAVATVVICAGTMLLLLNRLFPPKSVDLSDDTLSPEALRHVREIVPPKPYRIRLARFLGVAPSELENTRSKTGSRMKFWTSLTTFVRHGPKPTALIRFFLKRIRRAIHAEESAQRLP
jgi:hypothetical protein